MKALVERLAGHLLQLDEVFPGSRGLLVRILLASILARVAVIWAKRPVPPLGDQAESAAYILAASRILFQLRHLEPDERPAAIEEAIAHLFVALVLSQKPPKPAALAGPAEDLDPKRALAAAESAARPS